jgi:hypothetical protein
MGECIIWPSCATSSEDLLQALFGNVWKPSAEYFVVTIQVSEFANICVHFCFTSLLPLK